MKIAFIVDSFPALSETFVLNQITGMIDRGHDVQVFARMVRDLEAVDGLEDYRLLDRLHVRTRRPSNKIHRVAKAIPLILNAIVRNPVPTLNTLNVFKYGLSSLALVRFYEVSHLLPFKPEIYMCHFGGNGVLASKMKQYGSKAKIFTMFHGYDIRNGIEQGGQIYEDLFELGDVIFSVSDYNYKHLTEFGADPSKMIFHPNAIDIRKFQPPKREAKGPKDKVVILSVARLHPVKGLDYGLRAIKKLTEIVDVPVEYRIIGGGEEENNLKALIKELGIEKNVVMLGATKHEVVPLEMAKADVFFVCSVAEALPTVVMEAHAMKLPVVTTRVGSVHELALDGESGFIVDVKDSDQMAEALSKLVKDSELRLKFGEKGYSHIKATYDVNLLNDKLEKYFKDSIKKN